MERIDTPIDSTSQPEISQEERQVAMFCHLSGLAGFIVPFGSLVAPIIIWSLKKDDMPFVDEQGKEAINFQISMAIYLFVAIILCFVIIGIPVVIGLVLAKLAFALIAAVKASEGKTYRYPFTLRFV